ncbi:GDSL-type esterase/lipase family protein [Streptomyces sp. NBC_01546]|uniref:GDSL-type esterase/lipase family protein n=1 Tax=Streptomyces sp. NBC_01546 TaxID=2975872 RepID=UPI003868BD6B
MTSDVTEWITTPIEPLLRGALEVERTEYGLLPHRMPARARKQHPAAQLATVEAQPSGVRLVFRTGATAIELDTMPTKIVFEGGQDSPDGVYDLVVDGGLAGQATVAGGHEFRFNMLTLKSSTHSGEPGTARFAGLAAGVKDVEIWLPHNERTELIALRTDAPVEVAPESGRRVWLHHGSSLSQGSNAESPSGTWPAVAAAAGGVELVNLGLGGNALLDPFTARAMRDTPADVISVKIGIALVNTDVMRLRAFAPAVHGFLDTIREGHPDTPLLVISPVLCPMHEDTPGPTAPDPDGNVMRYRATGDEAEVAAGKLTLRVIRDELARITEQRAAEDPNLYYLDGLSLYGEKEFAELPLPDRLHPDAAGHRLIGERFAEQVFGAGGAFAAGV